MTTQATHGLNGRPTPFEQQSSRFSSTKYESATFRTYYEDESRAYCESYGETNGIDNYAPSQRPTSNGHQSQRRAAAPTNGVGLSQTASRSTTMASGGSLPQSSTEGELAGFSGLLANSPQRVRLVETQQERRCRPASADRFGSSSQRASRSSLGGAQSATRMGRFVNYYPASRQPSPIRRQSSPYAFHVPPQYQRASHHQYPQQQVGYGGSRTTSPSYVYAKWSPSTADGYSQATATAFQQPEPQVEPEHAQNLHGPSERPPPPLRQPRYTYVAPVERISHATPASKFNKSLRSRTISHLPSMVQVAVDDDYATDKLLAPATSENDLLLRRHVVAWRPNTEPDHDNPFKPGTELSWEAELMVRLIKRGYPIDQLPHLVEAAKQEARARQRQSTAVGATKSCDRLGDARRPSKGQQQRRSDDPSTDHKPRSSGYLRSNLRQANEARDMSIGAATNQRRPFSSSHSHSNLIGGPAKPPPIGSHSELTASYRGRIEQQPDDIGQDCKTIWASSLKRAKSVPRFQMGQMTDNDSLDKLITSIEMEIGELLEQNGNPDKQDFKRATESEKEIDGQKSNSVQKEVSPIRRAALRHQQPAAKSKQRNNGDQKDEQEEKRTEKGAPREVGRQKAMTKSKKVSQMADPETPVSEGVDTKHKKSKCCVIQ